MADRSMEIKPEENQKIKVAVRIRPLLEHEQMAGHDSSKF